MGDYLECLLLPELNLVLAEQAPGFEIIIHHADSFDEKLEKFINSKSSIDLGIGVLAEETPHLSHEELFKDQLVCTGYSNNLLLQKELTLDDYLQAEHLTLS